MSELLAGKVQTGLGGASRWLKLFNAAYSEKLGISVFPGSLNIALDQVFDWFETRYEAHRIWFGREEYGGERDILAAVVGIHWVVEVVSDVELRDHFGLQDGDVIEIRVPASGVICVVQQACSR